MPMKARKSRAPDVGWVTCWTVWHVRAKRYITRRDGKPFRFPKR